MKQGELAELGRIIGGFWPASDARVGGMVRWLNERGVTFESARGALTELAEQYDQMPSIKQLGVKLAELGTATRPELGVGARPVIERMKDDVLKWAREAANRQHITLRDRLRLELGAAQDYHAEALLLEDEDSIGYWRDRVTAIREVIEDGAKRGVA